ncbi:TPA: 50S ribosomal protein L15, partial [Campylobacter jejuni]|nr:50S ribosomal protein L15 [Campylobacter jejuni]
SAKDLVSKIKDENISVTGSK